MKRIVAAAAAAGLGLAALSAVPAGAAASPSTGVRGSVGWQSCPRTFPAGMECGMLAVPLDHADPAGRQIGIAVSRVRHTGPAAGYQGVLLVNPGGPGAAGREFAGSVAAQLPPRLRAAYDIVGFDPRGVGASRPALSCVPDYFSPVRPDYVPASPADEQAWLDRSRGYANACGRRYGALLEHLKTVDAARDLENLRVALGHEKINYLGASYGTYLGAVYATLYPGRVRRMVLDSIVQPSRLWYGSNLDQDFAFDASVKSFFAWVASHDAVYHLGGTAAVVEKAYYALRGELKAHPAHGILGPDELDDTLQLGGYLAAAWPLLARAWSSYAAKGDPTSLLSSYRTWGTSKEGEFAVYNAVQCTDAAWTRDWPAWRADTARVYASAPYQAWSNTWYNAPCLFWPARAGTPVHLEARRGLPDMLMFQATLDAATPYAGGLEMHQIFRGSRLVIEDGGRTHGVLQRGNACLDDKLNAYLATGALPPDVSHCARLPDPVP
ncbi:alpha/beta hydrolase [Actinomadura scrupuli]|uniref:alpha/beta hydrolase n=1 Tax=Actinomadura scrupuli TaxID=559629 RepID=UPI003D9588DB